MSLFVNKEYLHLYFRVYSSISSLYTTRNRRYNPEQATHYPDAMNLLQSIRGFSFRLGVVE